MEKKFQEQETSDITTFLCCDAMLFADVLSRKYHDVNENPVL